MKKSTRRAFLMSFVSLLMCVSMLVGTTYAWFTDSVSSVRNKIVSGTLDVELKYWDGDSYEPVTSDVKLFDDATLWEPGHTEVVYLEVSSLGSLALKYQLSVNVIDEASEIGTAQNGDPIDLADFLVFKTVESTTDLADSFTRETAKEAAGTTRGLKAYNGSTKSLDAVGGAHDKDYVALIVYMPETVGNDANHNGTDVPYIALGVNLLATQLNAESDSFGTDYDEFAWFDSQKVYSAQDLQAAINAGVTNITLMENIDLTAALTVPAAASTASYSLRRTAPAGITVDMNGKNITSSVAYDEENASASSVLVNNGIITLKGEGAVTSANNFALKNYGIMVIDGITVNNGIKNYGTLTVNGGSVRNGSATSVAISAESGNVEILGGHHVVEGANATLIKAQDGAEVSVSGGTFNQEFAKEFVADGKQLKLQADGSYKIEDGPVAQIGDIKYMTMDEAIANWTNGKTLTLLYHAKLSDTVTLKSTEHHILNLGKYTLTAADGKNAFEIKACGTGASERYAITIKADAKTPGAINAGKKSIVFYDYSKGVAAGADDRPIIKIEGGEFYGSTSGWGTAGIYFKGGSKARQAATLNVSGGTFHCSINGQQKSKLIISGGTFHYSVGSQGDSTANRLISGGRFKSFGFMTADSANTKFWFGTSMGNSNVGVYVDDEGYIVVGGAVITERGEKFAAYSTNYSGANSLLQYSSAKTNGLYYTSAREALADNNKTSGAVTVYVDTLDLTGSNFKGSITVLSDLTVTFAEGTTPAWKVVSEDGTVLGFTDTLADGVVTRTYTLA